MVKMFYSSSTHSSIFQDVSRATVILLSYLVICVCWLCSILSYRTIIFPKAILNWWGAKATGCHQLRGLIRYLQFVRYHTDPNQIGATHSDILNYISHAFYSLVLFLGCVTLSSDTRSLGTWWINNLKRFIVTGEECHKCAEYEI